MIQLLGPKEPAAAEMVNATGRSHYFLTCDHAGNRMPQALGTLGVDAAELQRHIAWDIGAAGVARRLAQCLDATLVLQTYSRLVIDCNRPPTSPTSIATVSELTEVPGNRDLAAAAREARRHEIFQPYHDMIGGTLDTRVAAGRTTHLLAIHSFTPVYKGDARPWHAGVLYNRDPSLAHVVLDLLRNEDGLVVGDNEPYFVSDETDYTVPFHAEHRHLPYVELEIRQDLISDDSGQELWAGRLERIFNRAAEIFPLRAASPGL